MAGFSPFDLVRDLAGGIVDEVGHLGDRLLDRRLKLAVTGLRRSGKTVFTTALIHHLLSGKGLPFLRAIHEQRYQGARLVPTRGDRFPYEDFIRDLGGPEPRWPQATDRLTTIEIEVRARSSGMLASYVQPVQKLFVEIIDYPGEWLLDLPLLQTDYAGFSAGALEIARRDVRRPASTPFLELVDGLAAGGADLAAIEPLGRAFRDYLKRAQGEIGLSLIQPGRLVAEDVPAELVFAPLPATLARTPLHEAMERRYRAYCDTLVRPFYRDHFSRFDRQIVLVDLFHSLNAGPDHFADTREALAGILESFRYGRNSWLRRLFSPSIDRVLFAASKADHVAANQHPNLKQLLELMVGPALQQARFEGIEAEVIALAALRCTDTVRTDHHGQLLSCVRGRLKDEARETVLFPGEIPPALPEREDWLGGAFRFHDFAPRRLEPGRTAQHIRLDRAIEFLIGDKLT